MASKEKERERESDVSKIIKQIRMNTKGKKRVRGGGMEKAQSLLDELSIHITDRLVYDTTKTFTHTRIDR